MSASDLTASTPTASDLTDPTAVAHLAQALVEPDLPPRALIDLLSVVNRARAARTAPVPPTTD